MPNTDTQFKKGISPWNKNKKCPQISGEKNPNWKGKVQIICKMCGKSFSVYPYRKDMALFCSKKCTYQDKDRNDKIGLKNSIKMKGKRNSPNTEFKKGVVSHNKGKSCPWAKNNPQVFKRGQKPWNTEKSGYKVHTIEHRKNLSEKMKGEKNWSWKNGVSKKNKTERNLMMNTVEYKLWRESVFTRDNYTCVWCGARSQKGIKVILNADHIKPWAYFPELRFAIDNGRTLCISCHKKTDTYGHLANKYKDK